MRECAQRSKALAHTREMDKISRHIRPRAHRPTGRPKTYKLNSAATDSKIYTQAGVHNIVNPLRRARHISIIFWPWHRATRRDIELQTNSERISLFPCVHITGSSQKFNALCHSKRERLLRGRGPIVYTSKLNFLFGVQ